jgi:uncharacterized membrane protein (DUF4010 family)
MSVFQVHIVTTMVRALSLILYLNTRKLLVSRSLPTTD